MAYRRLPNTDKARIETMQLLLAKIGDENIITVHQINALKECQTIFLNLITTRQNLIETRKKENGQKQMVLMKLKLCISHFFQVLNFAIIRGDIDKSCREHFGLTANTSGVPSLLSENAAIRWGSILIKGETIRIKEGGVAISHPGVETIENYLIETLVSQQRLQGTEKEYKQLQSEIKAERSKLDQSIKKSWNDIEFYFKDESIINKRKKAAQFGVSYVEN